MPMLTFVIGRLFGVAGQCHHRPTGMFRRYACRRCWRDRVRCTSSVAPRRRTAREIDDADDPVAKLAEVEHQLESLASPFRTAEADRS